MKIRKGREKLIVNNVVIFDHPFEFEPAQIDYLLNAGFVWNNTGSTLVFRDKNTLISYHILETVETDAEPHKIHFCGGLD